jgi:multisubunit Na+/H+ antiporter MnhB subunit
MIRTRSPIVRIGVQTAGPLALVVALFLLFSGHNRLGGGFAAGLVIGAVAALRTVTGLSAPTRAMPLLAAGGVLAAAVALAPVLSGGVLLDQEVLTWTLPALGKVKTGTALPFDVGVVLIVVGLVVAVLDGLGGADLDDESDTQSAADVSRGRS